MTRILFICRGNICRSPMAEFVMRNPGSRGSVAGVVGHTLWAEEKGGAQRDDVGLPLPQLQSGALSREASGRSEQAEEKVLKNA